MDSFFPVEIHFLWATKDVHPFGENKLLVAMQKHTILLGGVPSAADRGSLLKLLLLERDLQAYSWELDVGKPQHSRQRGVVRSHQ